MGKPPDTQGLAWLHAYQASQWICDGTGKDAHLGVQNGWEAIESTRLTRSIYPYCRGRSRSRPSSRVPLPV